MTAPQTIMGFDFGMKHIGVAIGQQITGTANGLTALKARDGIPNWEQIETLINQWRPGQIVVGLPLNMDGTEQQMTHAARKFGNRLHNRFKIPVVWQDERLSTFEALDQMGLHTKFASRQRSDVDKLSAQIILQSWLDQQ
ncbi:Putative Holliday junction resolvase [Methylophaga frappieri]|uniref:Putative pre-16S rRNA nuclease n=1 Tax=Methylophaga frappieri (strain ATCC BAA-2434 / DSM 25690 / JAM7) TaxID=754477 RepID=I1YJJ5_METFJ|nr:Holliday junction resolvase RuvX [Methylophaga frappieri]AFJ03088.1 Putative Holliday junction resolvase [Methylophaga frappieri]